MSKRKINYTSIFFATVIIVGGIILLLFLLKYINKGKKYSDITTTTTRVTEEAKTNNKGYFRSFYTPGHVGELALATFYDKENNIYTDVDIKGIRFLSEEEAVSLSDEKLNDGFVYQGFEYEITFNDLDYLKQPIEPIINVGVYNDLGYNSLTFNEHNYIIKVKTITDGKKINNKESKTLKIVYQYPKDLTYTLCFGYEEKNLSCFVK